MWIFFVNESVISELRLCTLAVLTCSLEKNNQQNGVEQSYRRVFTVRILIWRSISILKKRLRPVQIFFKLGLTFFFIF